MTTLWVWGRELSQLSWACISEKEPELVRSPAWRRMSPDGTDGVLLWVSDMQTILIEGW